MTIEEAIKLLEVEWDVVELTGFFGNLRIDRFEDEGFERVKAILDAVEIPEGETIDRRFVELTWFIPTSLHWIRDVWAQNGKDTEKLDDAIDFFQQRLTTILGLP